MKNKIAIILAGAIFIASATVATQWGAPTPCPGVNTSSSDLSMSIASNGDLYKIKNYYLYMHAYTGNYTWSSTEQVCTGLGTIGCATIDPSKKEGFIGDDYDVLPITSPDGINWTRGTPMSQWNRNPHYAVTVTCAWRETEKWFYVSYNDGIIWGAPEPYSNPQQINVGGVISCAGVRFTGDYMVISALNGSNLDLYELTGSGSSWGSRTIISEINNSSDEMFPVLGAIEGKNILLFTRQGDIWYSKGASNSGVNSTSLGRVKALFH